MRTCIVYNILNFLFGISKRKNLRSVFIFKIPLTKLVVRVRDLILTCSNDYSYNTSHVLSLIPLTLRVNKLFKITICRFWNLTAPLHALKVSKNRSQYGGTLKKICRFTSFCWGTWSRLNDLGRCICWLSVRIN